MSGRTEPVLGWRLWRLRSGQLWSWVLDNAWEPGPLEARCMIDQAFRPALCHREPCPRSPGKHCQCGIWALTDLGRCVAKGREQLPSIRAKSVVGLVAGWGTVAIHGDEGFRAQSAAILCLLRDSIWDKSLDPLCGQRAWRLAAGRWLSVLARRRPSPTSLRYVASEHAVPLLLLADALRSGVLAEFGLSDQRLERIRRVLG